MWEYIVLLCLSNVVTLYLYWLVRKGPLIHPIIRAKMTRIAIRFKINDTPDEVFAQTVVITDVLCNYMEQGYTIVARNHAGIDFPIPFSPDWSVHK